MSEVKIFERPNGWLYAQIKQKRGAGGAIFKSLRTRSREEAKQRIRDWRLEELSRAAQADAMVREVWTRLQVGRNLRVRDAIESYEAHRHVVGHSADTIREEGLVLDRFIRFHDMAHQPVAAIDATHVAAFVNQEGPQKLSTRELWLSILSAWLGYMTEQRWTVRNPALDVVVRIDQLTQEQLISTPMPSFTEAEVRKLLDAVSRTDFWHGAILFAYEYGLRIGAVAVLEDGNVVANRVRIYTTKGRRVVDEPLSDELWTWLQEWRAVRPASDTPYLFPVQAAIYESGSAQLSMQFSRLLAKHGIANRSFHGLRKAATARRWSAELDELGGADKRALMKLVAEKGYRAVQQMLAHAPGSDVTEKFYMPKFFPGAVENSAPGSAAHQAAP